MKFIIPRGVRLEARKKDILERKITRFPMAEFLTVPMPGITAERGCMQNRATWLCREA